MADDWTHIKADEIARRAIERLEAKRPRHPAAARHPAGHRAGLPTILRELKARGFKVVHVRAGDAGSPEDSDRAGAMGAAVRPACQPRYWPSVVASADRRDSAEPALAAPNPWNFGLIDLAGRRRSEGRAWRRVSSGRMLARGRRAAAIGGRGGRAGRAIGCRRPRRTSCRSPGRHNFRYSAHLPAAERDKTKVATRKPATTTAGPITASTPAKPKDPSHRHSSPAPNGRGRRSPIGHQFSVARPPAGSAALIPPSFAELSSHAKTRRAWPAVRTTAEPAAAVLRMIASNGAVERTRTSTGCPASTSS